MVEARCDWPVDILEGTVMRDAPGLRHSTSAEGTVSSIRPHRLSSPLETHLV